MSKKKPKLEPSWAGTGRERVKKVFVLSFVPTQPELEHSQKNCKKIQKIKKHHSRFISSKTRPKKE